MVFAPILAWVMTERVFSQLQAAEELTAWHLATK